MKVRVYTDYSPVRILRGVSGKEFVEPTDELAQKMGLEGAFIELEDSSLPSERTDRDLWKVVDGAIIVGEPTQEYSIAHFDIVKFQSDLASALVNNEFSDSSLRSEFAALNTYATNKDFEGMSDYLNWLVLNNIATEADVTVVLDILASQGVVP